MKTVKLLAILFITLLLTSCEDVIQVKLDQGPPIITIDAFVNNMRSQQKVRLTYTDGYFSQKPNEVITGASINIKDLTSGVNYVFTDNNNGDYVFTPIDTFKVGHNYELTVTHQGNVYKATTYMKRTTSIDSLLVQYKEAGSFGGKAGYKIAFIGRDIVGDTADYYWVKSYRNGVFFNKGSDINISYNAAYGDGSDGLFFIPPIAQGITPRGEIFNKYDVCRVEIHSISLETYNFLTQVQTQTTNSGLFATSPENIKTNLTNTTDSKTKVVGWFSMSAVGFKEVVAQ